MKQLQSDIAVLSAGTAGLAAAVTAAECGASVIAMEKTNHTGGTALRANQLFCVESKLQRIKQYPLSKEEAFKAYMDFMQWSVDARLIKTLIDMSTETMEWFEDMGVEFTDLTSHGPGGYYTAHIIKPDPPRPGLGGASTMMRKLEEKAAKLGVEILLTTTAKKIIRENGRITGVEGETRDGEPVRVNCKAVILATGGFGGHHRAPFGIPGLVGEGIRMAKEVGAETTEGTMPPPFGGDHTASAANLTSALTGMFAYPHLMVNLSGERFMNEEASITTPFGGNAVAIQKRKTAFRIFDEDTKDYFIENGLEFPGGFGIAQAGTPTAKVDREEFESEIAQILEKGSGMVIVADSIDELAEKTGIDKEGLKKTLDEYNRYCETGRDILFTKKARYLRPVKRPKFYATRSMGNTGTPEGVKVNYRTEVLTKEFEVIPGLYAAGGDMVCNLYKDIYPNILPGNAMGFALSTGRIAARSAVEYIRTVD
ncbi:MAG: FAD-binding protein [Dehalococcoidales bacterium]|nr:FAD-binding protein [Dehalococcoidales bacterium]